MANLELPKPPSKKWSLEEDDDDDNETKDSKAGEEEEEEDPLDAYMSQISKEVKKQRGTRPLGGIVKGVAKPKPDANGAAPGGPEKKKKGIVIMSGNLTTNFKTQFFKESLFALVSIFGNISTC